MFAYRECVAKKSEGLSRIKRRPTTKDWAQAIEELRRQGYALSILLERKQMARATFYYHLKTAQRPDKYAALRTRMVWLFDHHKGRYGIRRITLALRNDGFTVNHKTVERLMQQQGLACMVRRKKYRSYRGQEGRIAPNVLQRNFKATAPNQKWVTDVTEFSLAGEKRYLSPVLDLYNGEIISYTVSAHPNLAMVTQMLEQAIRKAGNNRPLIVHSDQGWHYQNSTYQQILKNNAIVQSMSRKGNCLDNAVIENFFGLLKSELLYLQKFDSMEQFERALKKYIKYYNNERIKAKLNGMSPVQFRAHYQPI